VLIFLFSVIVIFIVILFNFNVLLLYRLTFVALYCLVLAVFNWFYWCAIW